jgi:hypothetical protein
VLDRLRSRQLGEQAAQVRTRFELVRPRGFRSGTLKLRISGFDQLLPDDDTMVAHRRVTTR